MNVQTPETPQVTPIQPKAIDCPEACLAGEHELTPNDNDNLTGFIENNAKQTWKDVELNFGLYGVLEGGNDANSLIDCVTARIDYLPSGSRWRFCVPTCERAKNGEVLCCHLIRICVWQEDLEKPYVDYFPVDLTC
jgi:hypothetical protein